VASRPEGETQQDTTQVDAAREGPGHRGSTPLTSILRPFGASNGTAIHEPPANFATRTGRAGEEWSPAKSRHRRDEARAPSRMYYVYLLRSISRPDQAYVGYTAHLKERLSFPNAG
jgi:hypothetical protein